MGISILSVPFLLLGLHLPFVVLLSRPAKSHLLSELHKAAGYLSPTQSCAYQCVTRLLRHVDYDRASTYPANPRLSHGADWPKGLPNHTAQHRVALLSW